MASSFWFSSSSVRPFSAVILRTPITGRGGAGDAGAAVAVGLREVADRLAADEVVVEAAGVDELDGLRGNAFIVDIVRAEETFAVEGLQAGIVDDAHEIGQDARVEAGGKRAVGARLSAEGGPRGRDRAGKQSTQGVGGGVGAEEAADRDTPLRRAAPCAGRRARQSHPRRAC